MFARAAGVHAVRMRTCIMAHYKHRRTYQSVDDSICVRHKLRMGLIVMLEALRACPANGFVLPTALTQPSMMIPDVRLCFGRCTPLHFKIVIYSRAWPC